MPSVICMATCIKFSRSLAGPAGSLERDALNNLFLTILLSSCALTICRASILTADRSCAARPLPVYHRHLLLVERGQERPAVLGQAAAHLFRAGRRHHALERVGGMGTCRCRTGGRSSSSAHGQLVHVHVVLPRRRGGSGGRS